MKSLYLTLALLAGVSAIDAREQSYECCGPNKHHESRRSDAECPAICIDKVPFRIKKSGHYIVKNCFSHCDKSAAICVEADNVKIEFCQEAVLSVDGHSTGIRVKGNNVSILNGNFESKSDDARAIELCKNIKDWTIADCNFKNFEETISATCFENGLLKNCDFCQCRIGFQQNDMKSTAKNFKAKHIRAIYVDPNPNPCPPPFTPDFQPIPENLAAINNRQSWAISLNGEVINSTVQHLQLNGTQFYCFKCRDCVVNDIELDLPHVICEFSVGIQCGAPRGVDVLRVIFEPNNMEIRQGCINCTLSNLRVRYISGLPNQLRFIVGAAAIFCTNCEITDSQILMNAGDQKFLGIGLGESYCKNCIVRRTQVEGPSLIGMHICDFLTINEFCIGSLVEDCKVRNCGIGITNVRCHGPVLRNSSLQQNNIGVALSEGASNAIVDNCYFSENCIGLTYSVLEQNPNCFGAFFDDFCAAPCNGLVKNSCFVGNKQTPILVGKDRFGVDLTLHTGNGTVCIPNACNPGTNIFIDAVDGCGIPPEPCLCTLCNVPLVCPTPGPGTCPCICPVP